MEEATVEESERIESRWRRELEGTLDCLEPCLEVNVRIQPWPAGSVGWSVTLYNKRL